MKVKFEGENYIVAKDRLEAVFGKPDKSPEGHFDGPATISPKASLGGEPANCLLAGLVIYTENFKNKLTAEVFQTASDLMKKGASLEEVVKNIYK